jgi:hypothetical protein
MSQPAGTAMLGRSLQISGVAAKTRLFGRPDQADVVAGNQRAKGRLVLGGFDEWRALPD